MKDMDDKPITVEDLDNIVKEFEKRANSRPIFRFAVMTAAIAIGTHYGVGRHVVKMRKDLKVYNDIVSGMADLAVAQSVYNENLFDRILSKRG